jgi:arsenate reductase
MAEAFFNRLAAGRAEAVSAGTEPADSVDPAVVTVMREVGIDLSRQRPKALSQELVDRAERVISMGCGVEESCPATLAITGDWGLADPEGEPLDRVREVRDEIRARVVDLVETMVSAAA